MRDEIITVLRTSRPAVWIFPPLVFAAGAVISGATLSSPLLLQSLLLFIPFNIFLYGVNDIYDYQSDRQNPRKGGAEGEILPPDQHHLIWQAAGVSSLLLLASSLSTGNTANIAVMIGLLFAGYTYSAPPLRLKERPPFDSIVNGIIYFYGPVLLGFSFGSMLTAFPLAAIYLGISVMGGHALSTIMDYTADAAAGDTTFAVRFGKRAAAVFGVITIGGTLLLSGINHFLAEAYLGMATGFAIALVYRPTETAARYAVLTLAVTGPPTVLLYLLQQTGFL